MFTVNETKFGWAEIVAAAESWGEWQPFVATVREALACLSYAVATNQAVPPQELKAAVTAFRYAHNLISAEDAQAWLQRSSLSLDDWMNGLRARLLRERWADNLSTIVAAQPVSDTALNVALRPHALCTDRLGAWARQLAGRAAVAAASGRFDVTDCAPHVLIARIEAAFTHERERWLTPARLAAQVADHQLDWIRVAGRSLWFADERSAREAVWCITEDGLTLDEVGQAAHREVRASDFYLDELDAACRPLFLAARVGELLGPVKWQDGFTLFAIASKTLPRADDSQISARAETVLIATLLEQSINEHVRWHS